MVVISIKAIHITTTPRAFTNRAKTHLSQSTNLPHYSAIAAVLITVNFHTVTGITQVITLTNSGSQFLTVFRMRNRLGNRHKAGFTRTFTSPQFIKMLFKQTRFRWRGKRQTIINIKLYGRTNGHSYRTIILLKHFPNQPQGR